MVVWVMMCFWYHLHSSFGSNTGCSSTTMLIFIIYLLDLWAFQYGNRQCCSREIISIQFYSFFLVLFFLQINVQVSLAAH